MWRWFRRKESELDDEIRFHLEVEAEERMRGGLSPEEARYAAHKAFGNVAAVKEVTRGMWGWTSLEQLGRDGRYAVRALAHSPVFAITAVLSLGLGAGANIASFSIADSFLLQPLPVADPGELLAIHTQTPHRPLDTVSYPVWRDIGSRVRAFRGVTGHQLTRFAFASHSNEVPQMRFGLEVTDGFFPVLGVAPAKGRALADGSIDEVLLGHDFWRQQFGADAGVVGSTVHINGKAFTVVGVAPEQFTGMDAFLRPAFFLPVAAANRGDRSRTELLEDRMQRRMQIRARLRPGVTKEQAQAELTSLSAALGAEFPNEKESLELRAYTELELRFRESPQRVGLVAALFVLSLAVLGVACANIAGLLLARAGARSREVAVRLSIGAGAGRLVRQFLTESVVLSLAGSVAGVAMAFGAMQLLERFQLPTDTPIVIATRMNSRVLFFALGLSGAAAMLFGLAPALRAVKLDILSSLRAGEGRTTGGHGNWGRSALVVSQVAVSLVLLVTTGILLDAFRGMLVLNPGIQTNHLMMFEFDTALSGYRPERSRVFFDNLTDRVRALPGVRSATLTRAIPFRPNFTEQPVVPEGFEFPKNQTSVLVTTNSVGKDYFRTVETRLIAGRVFDDRDTASTVPVGIVNQEFARRYWPGQEALGKRFRIGEAGQWVQVVGVAETGKYLVLTEAPTPYVYVPYAQRPEPRMALLVRTEGDPASVTQPVREIVHALDANQPVFNVRPFAEFYEQGVLGMARLTLEMVGVLGLLGFGLALVGLYGLIAYTVSRRTREIGIRMAIGAGRAGVVTMVLRQALVLVGIGVVVGLALCVPVYRLLGAALVGVGGASPWMLVLVPLLLMITAMCACGVPALRAARIDPLVALRQD
ncbi:MAG: ABC transporter permease [Acidobacteria bacterium]|nr:ABC transporter permease [Acidobacteriota bacterium]